MFRPGVWYVQDGVNVLTPGQDSALPEDGILEAACGTDPLDPGKPEKGPSPADPSALGTAPPAVDLSAPPAGPARRCRRGHGRPR